MRTFLVKLIIALLVISSVYGQKNSAPLYKKINTDELNLSPSNVSVVQDATENLFIGNIEGLLIKSGKTLTNLDINQNSIVYTIYVSSLNQIFLASNKSFGYLKSTSDGKLEFKSFNKKSESRVRRITGFNDSIIFLSKEQLHIFHGDTISTIKTISKGFQNIFNFQNQIYYKEIDGPLTELSSLKTYNFEDSALGNKYFLYSPFTFENRLFFFSAPNFDLISLDKNKKTLKSLLIDTLFTESIKSNIGYDAIQLEDKLAISTRKNGVLILNSDSSYYFLNESNGLDSNIAAGLTVDNQQNLWVSLQNGLAMIEANSRWQHWNTANNLPLLINRVIKANGNTYISSMENMFLKKHDKWVKVDNLKGRIFGLEVFGSKVLAAAPDQGLFQIQDSVAAKVTNINNPWTIDSCENGKTIIPSEGNGVYILNKNLQTRLINNTKIGTPYTVKYINDSTAWLSVKWEGLYKINLKADIATLEFYDEKNGIPKTSEIDILKLGRNETVFATSKGFYQLNPNPDKDSTDFFIPVPYLNIKKPILKAAVDSQQNIWYATTNSYNEQVIKKLKHLAPNKYEDDSQGLQRFPNQIVNHIYPDPDEVGVIWIAGTKGLYKYDENIDLDFTLPFKTIMNRVSTGDSIIFHGFYSVENETGAPSFVDYQPDAYIPTLSYSNNNIKFEFSSSAYTYEEKNTYSYYLKGVDESWSNWNRRTQKEYSNLAPGKYIFQLKSKNLYGTEGKPTSYTFIIEAPWYLTTWAKIFFIVAGLLGIWVIVMLYNYRLRKHRKHLKLLVADRTFEVLSQKKEIELQYKKLSEQTEELKLQSEQIELKNRELEESQEEVLQINDTLEELNKQLEKKVEKRTAKIKLTLEKLKQTNKELDTFIYKASHDLKGPLSRILGLASLAKIETPSVKNIQYLDMIEHTSKDMDLLLSKLTQVHEIFNQHPKIVPLLVEEIIEEIKLKLNYLYSSEESEFVFNSTVNEPIYADHQLLYTVLFNLIENSLIYKNPDTQEAHQIKVSISKEDGQINIKIKDNGIGIKSDLLDAIFDMFYRASDRSKGSGLGLYLVKIAVEKMKGSIQVESTYLKHTTFNIKLPG